MWMWTLFNIISGDEDDRGDCLPRHVDLDKETRRVQWPCAELGVNIHVNINQEM